MAEATKTDTPEQVWEDLVKAVKKNDAKGIYDAVKRGGNVNGLIDGKEPLMHRAIQCGALQSMAALGEKGYNFALEDANHDTAMQCVVRALTVKKKEMEPALDLMLQMDEGPNNANSQGQTPSMLAHELKQNKASYYISDVAEHKTERAEKAKANQEEYQRNKKAPKPLAQKARPKEPWKIRKAHEVNYNPQERKWSLKQQEQSKEDETISQELSLHEINGEFAEASKQFVRDEYTMGKHRSKTAGYNELKQREAPFNEAMAKELDYHGKPLTARVLKK